MDIIDEFNRNHKNPYCEVTDNHFLLHAQVGISDDVDITPGTRVPIGEEPEELIDHLLVLSRFHKYFPSGTSQQQMEDTIVKALAMYRQRQKENRDAR